MHSSNLAPAGKAVEFTEVPGGFWVKTLVVEPTAKSLVKEGVYSAYSVGIAQPRIVRDSVAKNGRVVGGIFSEISLVDFPANPSCKFSMAKRASGVADIEILEKVEQPELTKRDFDKGTGGGVDRDKLPASDFAGPNRTYPIVTPGDVSDAAHLIGKADDPDAVKAKIISIAHSKGQAFVDALPESWKKDVDAELEKVPRKEHWKDGKKPFDGAAKPFAKKDDGEDDGDADDEKDKAEKRRDAEPHLEKHPEPDGDEKGPDLDRDEGGHGDATDVRTKSLPYHLTRLHDGLCPAYDEDDVLVEHPSLVRGIGALAAPEWFAQKLAAAAAAGRAEELGGLGAVYGAALAVQTMDRDLSDQALAAMHKAFAEYYPDAHPTPTDMEPGKFNRDFLGTGRAKETPGSPPRVPLASHTPEPGDFNRGPLTDGRQALSKRTYYTNAAKDQASVNLTALHDYIVGQHPEICPLHAQSTAAEQVVASPNGSSLAVAQPSTDTLPNRSGNMPTPVDEAHLASVRAGVDPELVKHITTEAIREATAPMQEQITRLEKALHAYEAAPDPAAAAPRHATAATAPEPKVATGGDEAPDPEQVADLVRLLKRARHRDSEVSRPAYEQLIHKFGPQVAAELI